MKLILTQPVFGLCVADDVVEVKDGYARNYLLPRKLGTAWTKGGQKQVDAIVAGRAARAHKNEEEDKAAKERLQSAPVTDTAHAGSGGRLYGAVTASDIAEAINAAGGPQVDKRRIEVPSPIRSVGEHTAHVRLHEDVSADITIVVEAG